MTPESVEYFRGYPVKQRRFAVAGRMIEVVGPDNYESLLDDPRVEARFAQDEYMPYWAEFWPASLLLADAIAAWGPAESAGAAPRVLEFGCGLGIAALVALQLGYAVTASDYDEDALAFVVESARRNGLPQPTTRYLDWRETYPELRFERIVAAEVLYEARNLEPIARFVGTHLTPDGFALICDRNRSTADGFERVAKDCGLLVDIQVVDRLAEDGGEAVRGRIFHLWRRRAAE